METRTVEVSKNLESFIKSDEYLSLEKEVRESVVQALASEEGEDIEPVMRLFDQQMAEHQPDAALREKLFWEIVADALKDGEFRKIHTDIGPLLDDAQKAEQFLNKKLNEIVEKLSPTIYKDLNRRGDAFRELKSRFYSYFPELGDLIVGAQEGKKVKTEVPKGRTEKETWNRGVGVSPLGPTNWPDLDEGSQKPQLSLNPEGLGYVLERTWKAPNLEEIAPGLVIEIQKIATGEVMEFEILSEPYSKPGNFDTRRAFVKVRRSDSTLIEERNLTDWGVLPIFLTDQKGKWKTNYIPTGKWHPKDEEERKGV